jgi:hypothetical protein
MAENAADCKQGLAYGAQQRLVEAAWRTCHQAGRAVADTVQAEAIALAA